MIRGALAWCFRTINSRIITTRPGVLYKLLKVSISASSRIAQKVSYEKDEDIEINNFDSNLILTINPSRSMGHRVYWTGFHEIKELIFLHHFLKPDMVFVDIGANLGEYTLFAAKRVPKGKVYSFEPLPTMQKVLDKNIRQNGLTNVTVMNYGLSDKQGELTIFEVKDRHEGLATFFPGDRESQTEHKARLNVLDDEMPGLGIDRVDFIKLDIEGSELFALRGARKLIAKFRPLVMVEINEETYTMAGYTSSDVSEFFASVHYLPFRADKNAELQPCSKLPALGNIIFCPS